MKRTSWALCWWYIFKFSWVILKMVKMLIYVDSYNVKCNFMIIALRFNFLGEKNVKCYKSTEKCLCCFKNALCKN